MSEWTRRAASADGAVTVLKSGMRVFVHGAAGTPTPLLEAMVRNPALNGITLYHLHTTGPAPFVDPLHRDRFFSVSVFAGSPVRRAINEGAAEFIPAFLSDIPSTAARGTMSRIVLALKPGAGVVTTRGHVHWVVTGYGAVRMRPELSW